MNNVYYKKGLSNGQKVIIILMFSIFLLLLLFVAYNKSRETTTSGGSKTIMLYVDGSNLESNAKIVTAEINSIIPSQIDLEHINILMYTGGTEKWHNFIKNDENAIYLLKENGFEKIETYPQKNMGNHETLTEFLNYCYNNYKADNYNLIFYDHGGAVDGAIYDDFTNDNLSLVDIVTALTNSPFSEDNKLETITFRTCLNGTIEVATALSKFSKYMIASEEITYGANTSSVLNFLNDIEVTDSGIDYGKKFINSYQNQMNEIDFFQTSTITYAITDLSKINNLNAKINDFFQSIDMNNNYVTLARTRSNLFQFGDTVKLYDMVDLYDLVNNIKHINSQEAQNLLAAIDETILYNHTNLNTSHGLSIYFPYNGTEVNRNKFLNIYKGISSLSGYYSFISKFNNYKNSQTSQSFSFAKNETKVSEGKNIIFKLTEEQEEAYGNAVFMIFSKDKEHEGYYFPIYSTDEVNLKDGALNANISDKLLKVKDEDGTSAYITLISRDKDNSREFRTVAMAFDYDENILDGLDSGTKSVNLYLADDNGTPKVSFAKLISKNELADGTVVNLNEIEKLRFFVSPYKIVDKDGNVIDDWQSAPVLKAYDEKTNELEFEWSSLDNEGEYYCLFEIFDINGYAYYSKLIKVGD